MKRFVGLSILLAICIAAFGANNNHIADSVVWKETPRFVSAHLYRDDLDTMKYNYLVTPELDDAISSYNNSSYAKDGGERVKQAFLKAMHGLTDTQVKALQRDCFRRFSSVRIGISLYNGNIVKTYFNLPKECKVGSIPDAFILEADKKIRTVKFQGLDSYGIKCLSYHIPISNREMQDYTCIKSDFQTYIENQKTLWVLDGVVMKDTKDLTIDMIDCAEPYIPLGKALGKEPSEFESLSVITGKTAEDQYGTKKETQVVVIKTKDENKKVTIDKLALGMQRARFENLGKGEKLDIDYNKIEGFIKLDPSKYQELMNRFLANPDSLTTEEAVNLYYGFAFTDDYNPIQTETAFTPQNLFSQGKTQEAYDACKEELQKSPVSLSLLLLMSNITNQQNNKKEARYYYSRFYVLYSAVIASGNGFSKDKALKVLYIPDEYAIFRDMMSMKLVEQRLVDYRYDCMTLDRGIKGETVTMWFDTYLRWRYIHNSKR